MNIYFAWATQGENFALSKHLREDEQIFSVEILHQEGSLPQASLIFKNYRENLVSSPHKYQAFLSVRLREDVHLLFAGRPMSAPKIIGTSLTQITFTVDPLKSNEQWQQACETYQKEPQWDPLFYPLDTKPTLEATLDVQGLTPHWHRHTGALTIAHRLYSPYSIALGKAFFPHSLSFALKHLPLQRLNVTLEAQWHQHAQGVFDLGTNIATAFSEQMIATYTPQDLIKHWWDSHYRTLGHGYALMNSELSPLAAPLHEPKTPEPIILNERNDTLPCHLFTGSLLIGWTYRQKRVERLKFSLYADCQPLHPTSAAASMQEKDIHFQLQDITHDFTTPRWEQCMPYEKGRYIRHGDHYYQCQQDHQASTEFWQDIDYWHKLSQHPTPLSDPAHASFFITPRGHQAFAHALLRAGTILEKSQRAFHITFEAPIEPLLAISCNHHISLEDPRLPGGIAEGKVLNYKICFTPEKSSIFVTLGCTLGRDAPPPTGTPLKQQHTPTAATFLRAEPLEGLAEPAALPPSYFVHKVEVQYPALEQRQLIERYKPLTPAHAKTLLDAHPTQIQIQLKPLVTSSALYSTLTVPIKHPWVLPKHIDLNKGSLQNV